MTQSINPPVKILFVCVGNACRSQMAEAWANHYGKGRVEVYSAGSHAYGAIVDETCTVMSEKGISLDRQWSKGLAEVALADMDVVVSMGEEVECPLPAGFKGQLLGWNIPDPYARGMGTFRKVRDMIEQQVWWLLSDLLAPDVPM
jgi:arsenate reductase (thioredoxin)